MSWAASPARLALLFFAAACFSFAAEEIFVRLVISLPLEIAGFAWFWIYEAGDDFVRNFPYLLTSFTFLNDFLLHIGIMVIPMLALRKIACLPQSRSEVITALAGILAYHLLIFLGFYPPWYEVPYFRRDWMFVLMSLTQPTAFLFLLWLLRPRLTDQWP